MASTTVYNTLKTVIQDAVTPLSVLDFDQIEPLTERASEAQQGSDVFLVIEELQGLEDLVGFGGNLCNREQGVVEVHAFNPAPQSSDAARTQAELIQGLLRNQTLTNGLRILSVSPATPGTANNGLWTVYSVAVAYEMDTVHAHPVPLL